MPTASIIANILNRPKPPPVTEEDLALVGLPLWIGPWLNLRAEILRDEVNLRWEVHRPVEVTARQRWQVVRPVPDVKVSLRWPAARVWKVQPVDSSGWDEARWAREHQEEEELVALLVAAGAL